MSEVTILPDGSAFALGSFPLPADHWLYESKDERFTCVGAPPAPLRLGNGPLRDAMAAMLWEAGKYAVRAATRCGTELDFDPDALVMNLVVGLLGPGTETGYPDPGEVAHDVPA